MPSSAPTNGVVVEPSALVAAWVAAHRKSAVSRPSRPTASMATTARLARPASAALSTLPRSSPDSPRAWRAIQNTIQVTKQTATMDRMPPIASCASNVKRRGPNVSSAPNASDTAMATAIPAQSRGSSWRRSDLTRYAIRMTTTRLASSPSRRPIR